MKKSNYKLIMDDTTSVNNRTNTGRSQYVYNCNMFSFITILMIFNPFTINDYYEITKILAYVIIFEFLIIIIKISIPKLMILNMFLNLIITLTNFWQYLYIILLVVNNPFTNLTFYLLSWFILVQMFYSMFIILILFFADVIYKTNISMTFY